MYSIFSILIARLHGSSKHNAIQKKQKNKSKISVGTFVPYFLNSNDLFYRHRHWTQVQILDLKFLFIF